MNKQIIFISHITREAGLAQLLKKHLTNDFPDLLDIFVSSDYKTIKAGKEWLGEIKKGLKASKVEIILCSKESVTRPWVNFEAGAAWILGKTVIPVCHSGMNPSELPSPLSFFQVVEVNKEASLESLYDVIAKLLGVQAPTTNYKVIGAEINQAEIKMKVARVSTKYYHMVNFKSGDCLDVEAFKKGNGIGIFQWYYHGGIINYGN
jgi:hypothetical protein